MDPCDILIRRIVSRSGILSPKARQDLERELHAHFEDAVEEVRSQGYHEPDIPRLACDRFGDAEEIARAIARVHRFEYRRRFIARALALMSASTATVASLILGIQLLIAIASGVPLSSAFSHWREELISLGSLSLGYTGLQLIEGLFKRRRLVKALGVNCVVFAFLFSSVSFGLHVTVLSSPLAFICGAAVCMLQQTVLSSAWVLGTAVPMLLFSLTAAPLGNGSDNVQLGIAALVRWIGITFACYLLTLLSRKDQLTGSAPNAIE
jgi:hypothetical protein